MGFWWSELEVCVYKFVFGRSIAQVGNCSSGKCSWDRRPGRLGVGMGRKIV